MRNLACELPFARVGQDVVVWPQAVIVSPETISIGDSVIISDFAFIAGGARTVIGSFVHIAPYASVVGGGEFLMEDFTGLSGGVRVYTGADDYTGGSLTNPTVPEPYRKYKFSFVHLRKHSLVGANSVVLAGVTLHEGAAVGANSFVRKDCEPWTIYAGSPARPIGPRNRETMLKLEAELRRELFDRNGRYIPRAEREPRP